MRDLLAAVTFLTILRPPGGAPVPPAASIGRSLGWYPLVGAFVGGLLALAAAALGALPPAPRAVALTLLWAVVTGGLHLDGVADVCDGLFSSRTRDEALRIMRDAHVGAMGVVGLVGLLAAKIAALASIPEPAVALVAAGLLGRWAVVAAAATSRYARASSGGGLATGVIEPRPARLAAASVWPVAALALVAPPAFAAAWLAAAAVAVGLRAVLVRRFGGLTGDCLGAVCEAAEAAVLFVYAGAGASP